MQQEIFQKILKKLGNWSCRTVRTKCDNITGYHICSWELKYKDVPEITNLFYTDEQRARLKKMMRRKRYRRT
jgi:hypothetical protein